MINKLCCQSGHLIILPSRPAVFDFDVLTFDEPCLSQPLVKAAEKMLERFGRAAVQKPYNRYRCLLRPHECQTERLTPVGEIVISTPPPK